MLKFLLKRLLEIIPVLFIISFIVFTLVFVAGDPVALMLPEDASQEDIENFPLNPSASPKAPSAVFPSNVDALDILNTSFLDFP